MDSQGLGLAPFGGTSDPKRHRAAKVLGLDMPENWWNSKRQFLFAHAALTVGQAKSEPDKAKLFIYGLFSPSDAAGLIFLFSEPDARLCLFWCPQHGALFTLDVYILAVTHPP